MIDRAALLAHLQEDEKWVGARAVDLAEAARADGAPRATDFLDPHQRQIVEGIVARCPGLAERSFGGYRDAERRRMLLYPDFFLTELLEWPLAAVAIEGPFGEEQAAHRDFLGALLATGLKREKIGDLLLTPEGCQAVVASEVVDHVLARLDQVGRTAVRTSPIELEQLSPPTQREKEVKGTVASLRLDAVASCGFGISRTRLAREIKGERIRVNWRPVDDPAHPVREGDVISLRGRGRAVLHQVNDRTRKGRIGIILKRFM